MLLGVKNQTFILSITRSRNLFMDVLVIYSPVMSLEIESDEISSCPFCDSVPELVETSRKLGARQGPSVRCSNTRCVAWGTNLCEGIFANAAEAIRAWNTLSQKLRVK